MLLFGGEFCTLEGFNKKTRERFDIKCRCCTCKELNLFKNSTDLKCIEERTNFDSLRFALLTVFQVEIYLFKRNKFNFNFNKDFNTRRLE